MTYVQLYTSVAPVFAGFQKELDDADYVIVGIPLDITSTYRTGSRFAPLSIREASLNIETYSFRSEMDVEETKLHDAGDLHVSGDLEESIRRVELVTREIFEAGKTPILIGGEHTVTLGAVRGFSPGVAIISFDAHLDLRDVYMDRKISHATFMRRLTEEPNIRTIVEVGTRAVCREEIGYAKTSGVKFFTAHRIMKEGVEAVSEDLQELLKDCEAVYITVDMDVLDPASAPAVQNPEPDGLSTSILLDLLCNVCDSRVVGFDLTEVTPSYDSGTTSVQAAKIVFECICRLERTKRFRIRET